jgi:hypothetical protein
MVLKEWLSGHPDEVVYIGCDSTFSTKIKANGSGFIYIGYAKNAPHNFDDREVKEIYERTFDIPGTILIVEGLEVGKYWTWHEADPSVPAWECDYTGSPEPFEELFMGIAKLTAKDYQAMLMKELRERKPQTTARIDSIITACRKKAILKEGLGFLKGTNTGEYLIQAVEDQVKIRYMHPDLIKLPYEDRYEEFQKKRKELRNTRVKASEKSLYATIKGRSVNHDLG